MKRFKNLVWRPHFKQFKRVQGGEQFKSKMQLTKSGQDQVREYIYKFCGAARRNGDLEIPVSKRIKRYPMYKMVSYDNKIYSQFRYGSIRDFKLHYRIGNTNRIVGYTPDYIGFRPSEQVQCKNFITEFLLKYYYIIEERVSNSCFIQLKESATDTRVVYSGGYDSVHSHLSEFFKDNSTSIMACDIISKIGTEGMRFFCAPFVNFNDVKELMYNVRVNPNAYTGHYTSKLINRKTSAVNHISREVAKMMWLQMHKHPLKNVYLWDILGREKDIKLDPSGQITDVGTRAVLATEDSMKTLLMWFAQKYHVAISTYDNKTFDVTGEYDAKKFSKLQSYESSYDYKLDADWSQFDANCDTQFIIAACCLILSGLPEDTLHKNIKNLIISSLVTKYVAVPPGIVVELNRGVPSGHPFTTLINCTINTIYWCLIAKEIYGEGYSDKIKIEVYGDDTYIYFKYHANLFNIDYYIKKLGLKSEPLKERLKLCNFDYNYDELPDFLKRRYDGINFKWNHKKMFDKFIYMSKKRNIDEQIQLFTSFYQATPFDNDILELMKLFNDFLNNSEYYDAVRTLDSYKKLEELVKLGDNVKIKFSNFMISNISYNSVDYFSKITNLISTSVYMLKSDIYTEWRSSTNKLQRTILYSLCYPLTFINKNKYIFDHLDTLEFEYKNFDDIYYKNVKEFTRQQSNKIIKDIYTTINKEYQKRVNTNVKYIGDSTYVFSFK